MITIFYARISDGSYETNTIENQFSIIKHYYYKEMKGKECKDSSIKEVEEVVDNGYSGMDMNRPGMQYVLNKVVSAQVDMIVAKDISRISRNYIELGALIKKCLIYGVQLITVLEGNYTKGQDYFMKDIRALLADVYSKEISIKVKSSLDIRKDNGIYALPLLPFGYKKEGNKIISVSEEASVIRCIFSMFEKEKSISCVKKYLDSKGILTPKEYTYIKSYLEDNRKCMEDKSCFFDYNKMAKETRDEVYTCLGIEKKSWSYATIRKILTNEFYIGTMVYNKTTRRDWSSKRRERSYHEKKIYDHHEAIISKELFLKVKSIHLYNITRNNRK